jgi:hypothetical protein
MRELDMEYHEKKPGTPIFMEMRLDFDMDIIIYFKNILNIINIIS